jgi:energy-coupling factor transporter ATP-binding protein EcfA2
VSSPSLPPAPDIAPIKPRDVVTIVGKRGTGKSTCAKYLCKALREHQQRVLVFDPHDEYSVKARRKPEVRLGPLRNRIHLEELLLQPELLDANDLSLAVVPSSNPEVMAVQFTELVELVENTGDLVLVADELGDFEVYCRPIINRLATQSRHWSVCCVLVSQRMIHIPKTARTQSSHLVTFLQTDPEDLDAIAALVGRHGGKEFAESVSRLRAGEWKHWRDELSQPVALEKMP